MRTIEELQAFEPSDWLRGRITAAEATLLADARIAKSTMDYISEIRHYIAEARKVRGTKRNGTETYIRPDNLPHAERMFSWLQLKR